MQKMPSRTALLLSALLASTGHAQTLVFTADNEEFIADLSTAPSLAVGGTIAIVVGSHGMHLINKASPFSVLFTETYAANPPVPVRATDYPFVTVEPLDPFGLVNGHLVFPSAAYDPYTGRLWMASSDSRSLITQGLSPEVARACTPFLHLAVQKDLATNPQSDFSTSQWWYYTGPFGGEPVGAGGHAFNFGMEPTLIPETSGPVPFRDSSFWPEHRPPKDTLVLPLLAFEEDHVIVASTNSAQCNIDFVGTGGQTFHIFPRTHMDGSTPKSILDGDRPKEGDLVMIRLTGRPLIPDSSFHNRPVQEPFEQVPNTTLFISTTGVQDQTPQEAIRLKALFWDSVDGEWEVRQQLKFEGQELKLKDMVFASSALRFRNAQPGFEAPEAPGFQPTVEGDAFTSAVLAKDIHDNWRVFAVHSAIDASPTSQDHWRVQWYIIDPKLDDIIDSDVLNTDWQPELVGWGIIDTDGESQPGAGHAYHPSLAVSPNGEVFIEYTYSSETERQRIVRAKLITTGPVPYTSVVSYETLKEGPDIAYNTDVGEQDRWAMFSSMQIDPVHGGFGNCNFTWSAHTLVFNDSMPFGTPPLTDSRDIWLFRKHTKSPCFSLDLNANGLVDPFDLLLYTDWYISGDERADTDMDGVVDAVDMANYLNAYQEATQP